MFDSCSHIRGKITDYIHEVKLGTEVPNILSMQVIHQCSAVRSNRVTVLQKHPWMIYAEPQSADKPLPLQSELAIYDLGSVDQFEFTS